MPIIPPEFESVFESLFEASDTIPSARVDVFEPLEHPAFDSELKSFERRLRLAREHSLFGVHPDGVGPTLGQDLGKPNPGDDLDWEHQAFDPKT
jgi:hypothetical protein